MSDKVALIYTAIQALFHVNQNKKLQRGVNGENKNKLVFAPGDLSQTAAWLSGHFTLWATK